MLIAMRMTPFPILIPYSVIIQNQRTAIKILRWFENIHIKTNPGKSHVLLSSNIEQV